MGGGRRPKEESERAVATRFPCVYSRAARYEGMGGLKVMKGLLRTSALMNKECRAIGASMPPKPLERTGARGGREGGSIGQMVAGGAAGGGGGEGAGGEGSCAKAKCTKWYVAEYEWFAEEVKGVLAGVRGMAASADLGSDDVVLQLTSYRDVSWVRSRGLGPRVQGSGFKD